MKHQKGFTLIELLVVIAVIGILAAVVLASLNDARAKARDTKRIADLHQIRSALEMYYNDNGYYPPTGCGYDCNSYRISTDANWQSTLGVALAPYISALPVDPINNVGGPWVTGNYSYSYGNVTRTTYAPGYDLTGQFETNHPLRCALKQYRFWYNNANLWCGTYSPFLYEASTN